MCVYVCVFWGRGKEVGVRCPGLIGKCGPGSASLSVQGHL